jgi:hypothetical protein
MEMTKWTFFGRVLPERIPLKISDVISGRATFQGLNITLNYNACIADGQIVVDVTVIRAWGCPADV